MGLRRYKRDIARNRMAASGCERVNRNLSMEVDGLANWRRALTGATGEQARQMQMQAHRPKPKSKMTVRRV